MTAVPASRGARAMIFALRSCPSRPGLATTTRIFWLVLGADMGFARRDSMPGTATGPRGAPRSCARWCRGPVGLGHLQLQRHAGVHVADDRVRAGLRELPRDRALRPHLADRALRRALGDRDVVRQLAGPLELDGVALLDAERRRPELHLRADLDGLRGGERRNGD